LFTACKKKIVNSPCNVDKNFSSLSVDFFAYVAGKKSLSRQQSHFFADVTMIFSMAHQQKSQHMGVKHCRHCKGHNFFFAGGKTKHAYIAGVKIHLPYKIFQQVLVLKYFLS
jgi:hypothetical protein